MSESNRVIDLDDVGSVSIKLGGEEYQIRQQRQAIIEKVLRFAHEDPKMDDGEVNEENFAEVLFRNWDAALPTLALCLGCEGEAAVTGCVKHLKEHLTIPGALRIWELWWEINRIQDFFNRGGRALLPPYILDLVATETAAETA